MDASKAAYLFYKYAASMHRNNGSRAERHAPAIKGFLQMIPSFACTQTFFGSVFPIQNAAKHCPLRFSEYYFGELSIV